MRFSKNMEQKEFKIKLEKWNLNIFGWQKEFPGYNSNFANWDRYSKTRHRISQGLYNSSICHYEMLIYKFVNLAICLEIYCNHSRHEKSKDE